MLTLLLASLALAGEPSFKGAKLLDDGAHVMTVKTQNVFGLTSTTVTAKDGSPVLAFNLSPYQGQVMLSVDFSSVGLSSGGLMPAQKPDELILAWWKAGVLSAAGVDRAKLEAWCKERGFALTDTAKQQAQLAEYAATHPGPTFSEPAPSASASASVSSAPAAPARPTTVSVSFHIECDHNVRMFTGSSPTSGGTYGWESPNSVRSTTMRPGDVLCICDDRDKVQSCWTAGDQRADLEVTCGGFRQR
jgi:hypothetical protein